MFVAWSHDVTTSTKFICLSIGIAEFLPYGYRFLDHAYGDGGDDVHQARMPG